jgi:hypothetical protein
LELAHPSYSGRAVLTDKLNIVIATTARGAPASDANRLNWLAGASWTSHPGSGAGKCPMACRMTTRGPNVSGSIYSAGKGKLSL